MPSTSETGHAKNVANFEDLIAFCTSYGGSYNPSRPALSVASLGDLFADANTALQNVKEAKITFDNATNARQAAFKDLKHLATKVVNALSASGASELVVKDARTINRKIQGAKTPSKPPTPGGDPETPVPKTISSSRQSYDSLIDNFTLLIELLAQEPLYTPNETELQTVQLTAKLNDLKTSNTAISTAYTSYSNTQVARDTVLYDPANGLVPIALECKKYIKSVYGASSPQYKQVSGLQFKGNS